MPPLLTHIIIPLFILLLFAEQLKLSKQMIIILSIFGIFPDVDIIMFHRATLHNIFILLIPIGLYIITKNKKPCGIIGFFLISHIILDLFVQGVYVFYPFYDIVIYPVVGISYQYATITPILELRILGDLSSEFIAMPMVSGENTATILLLIIMFIVVLINKHRDLNSIK